MDKKLRHLLNEEKLTAGKLADILETQPAAISHILNGRNRPSFDLICKLVNRFPHINPYWLLGDSPDYLKAQAQPMIQEESTQTQAPDLWHQGNSVEGEKSNIDTLSQKLPILAVDSSKISKVIVVYSDNTFVELSAR